MSKEADEAWVRFDDLVARAPRTSPWSGPPGRRTYTPDHELLKQLLAVPLELGCTTQSGIPAKAVDVWVAHELRRCQFEEDSVWPRPSHPRVVPIEIQDLLDQLPKKLAAEIRDRLATKKVGGTAGSMDAHVLGKAYEKQVDVVMARWSRGAELMVSTKRMDSSFGKNALNRIEESYGDAKNLRGRHPLASIGFLFVIRATALVEESATTERLMGLLAALAHEDDAYDATGLIMTDWTSDERGGVSLTLYEEEVPPELRSSHFMETMVRTVLSRTPIDTHVKARALLLDRELAVEGD